MMSKKPFVDNNCYAIRIVGEPYRTSLLYLALAKDSKGCEDIIWVKNNISTYIGVPLFSETPVIVRDVLKIFFPGDVIKVGAKRKKTYILKGYGDFLLLERVIKRTGKLR